MGNFIVNRKIGFVENGTIPQIFSTNFNKKVKKYLEKYSRNSKITGELWFKFLTTSEKSGS